MRVLLLLLLFTLPLAGQKVYWILWFDTEDYLLPKADDAALRLAQELDKLGVPATFKVVGEKARVLEKRGRKDVISALRRHDIGYHAENHSVPPTPSVYLSRMGMLEGAAEFERREGQGLKDVERVFGRKASTYGQPGNSWGPQSTIALRRMGIPTYVDEAAHIEMKNLPFWYGGLLHVTNLGPNAVRTELNKEGDVAAAKQKFEAAVARVKQAGGGIVQTYYHPTELVTTEFWDGVNFRHGKYTAPKDYVMPKERTAESSAQAYRNFVEFVKYVKSRGDVEITSVDRLMSLYDATTPTLQGEVWKKGIGFEQGLSAAEILSQLLGVKGYVDGPERRGLTTYTQATVERGLWEHAVADARAFVNRERRLPAEVWLGSATLSLADFAMTLARAGKTGDVKVEQGTLLFEKQIATDGNKMFNWVIHPQGFDGSALLDLGRLQAWTLKPARMK
jgi:hypothetical protein